LREILARVAGSLSATYRPYGTAVFPLSIPDNRPHNGTELMDMRLDTAFVGRGEIGPIERLVRLGMSIYLSPVILVVLAIGLIGLLAAKLGKTAGRVAVVGIQPNRMSSRQALARPPR
jgi:hypothetical protein